MSADAPEPESYAAAVAELDQLLAQLERGAPDVDALVESVRRASWLLTWCRARLTTAEVEITEVVAHLDP